MEETKILSPQIKGLIISLIAIILGIVGYYTGLSFKTGWYAWLINLIILVAIIIACVQYANQKDGYVTFGNVFAHGFKISAVIAVIMLVYTLLSVTVLFPDIKDRLVEAQQAKMEEQGLDSDKIDTALTMMKKYFTVFAIGGAIFGTIIWGCIASLIGAAIAKKKPVNPIQQNM